MSKGTTSQDAPFGTLLGYAPGGVAIYSSDYSSLDPQEYEDDAVFRSYIDDEYMGHKWQCVEFARRFLFLNYGVVFTDVGMAWEIFSLRFLREVVNDNILSLQAFPNGSPRAPVAGALLIWDKGGEFKDTGSCRHHYPIAWQQSPYCGTERDSFPVAARATVDA